MELICNVETKRNVLTVDASLFSRRIGSLIVRHETRLGIKPRIPGKAE